MTNILVVSDSHRDIRSLRVLAKLFKGQAQRFVHLGDCVGDMAAPQREFPGFLYDTVRGNCDSDGTDGDECILTVNSARILLTHGHRYNVKMGTDRLVYRAMELEVSAALFGHTHTPALFETAGILFMNPGSTAFPRAGYPAGYGLLRVSDDGAVQGKLLQLTHEHQKAF